MTSEVHLPVPEALKLKEVKAGLWKVLPSEAKEAYGFFEVSALFKRRNRGKLDSGAKDLDVR